MAARSRRSIVVAMFGAAYALVGFAQLGTAGQLRASPAAARSYKAHLDVMPLDAWAWLFIGAGLAAVLAGATMWHTAGFGVLTAVSGLWGLNFVASWASTGYDRAVIGALTWLLLAGILLVCAGWRDPPPDRTGIFDAFLAGEEDL